LLSGKKQGKSKEVKEILQKCLQHASFICQHVEGHSQQIAVQIQQFVSCNLEHAEDYKQHV